MVKPTPGGGQSAPPLVQAPSTETVYVPPAP
jgi:hypothetical protein